MVMSAKSTLYSTACGDRAWALKQIMHLVVLWITCRKWYSIVSCSMSSRTPSLLTEKGVYHQLEKEPSFSSYWVLPRGIKVLNSCSQILIHRTYLLQNAWAVLSESVSLSSLSSSGRKTHSVVLNEAVVLWTAGLSCKPSVGSNATSTFVTREVNPKGWQSWADTRVSSSQGKAAIHWCPLAGVCVTMCFPTWDRFWNDIAKEQ